MSASKVTRTGAELMKLRFITEFDNVYELFTVQKSHYNYLKLITGNICNYVSCRKNWFRNQSKSEFCYFHFVNVTETYDIKLITITS